MRAAARQDKDRPSFSEDESAKDRGRKRDAEEENPLILIRSRHSHHARVTPYRHRIEK
jgi:hypothetical protein